jgi:hypothetical protein
MKSIHTVSFSVLIATLGGFLLFLSASGNVNAQQTTNLTDIIKTKFPQTIPRQPGDFGNLDPVQVKYESNSTILIGGDLIYGYGFNSALWEAMDLLKNQYGFKLQTVMTSGVGSQGNPTVVYIVMTK